MKYRFIQILKSDVELYSTPDFIIKNLTAKEKQAFKNIKFHNDYEDIINAFSERLKYKLISIAADDEYMYITFEIPEILNNHPIL